MRRVGIVTVVVAMLLALAQMAHAAEPRVVLKTAGEEAATWRYTFEKPGENWAKPGFDAAGWKEGKAGFGVPDQVTPEGSIGTPWKTGDIWLRKSITVADPAFATAALRVRHDDDVEVFVNGTPVFAEAGFNTEMTAYDVTETLRPALKAGENLLAVHVHQEAGGQYIDVGLVLDPKEKPAAPAIGPAALQKLREARWPAEKAWKWYAAAGPIRGFNYLPRTAVNTTEMWQGESFDPKTIDEELGWAAGCGFNSARVFVQYVVYEADPKGLIERMDKFLEIADRHKISVMVVLLDDCFLPEPKVGKQPDPVPGVHNSQWTQSPGERRKKRENWPALEKYVKDVVGHFANDRRVLAWDLYNEPAQQSRPLVEAAFSWARAINPSQPLTTCWQGMDLWDIGNYHDYTKPDVKRFEGWRAERPALCTECIARGAGSRFDNVLPAMAEAGVGWYMWGLVKGRTQTYFPWGSPKGAPEPTPWHHDLLQPDGKAYRAEEVEMIKGFAKQFKLPEKAQDRRVIPAKTEGKAVPQEAMEKVYNEVRTPFKYGIVLRGEPGQMIDCPTIFRQNDRWYMVYVGIRPGDPKGAGYETFLARSADLLHWEKLGKIMSFRKDGWDRWQVDGGIALCDPTWGGTSELETFDGRYWMSYIGGAQQGYEPDPLSIGMAWTKTPAEVREWTAIAENPVLTRDQADVRAFEKETLYKSQIIRDKAMTLGAPFVMFYNGKLKGGYEKIGMAVSADMVHWKRYGTEPVVANGEDRQNGISGDPQLVRMGDLWVMFYFGAFWKPKAFDTFACSYDLVSWTKWNGPHLVEPTEPWDREYAHKPWVLKHDGVVYHFYCAVGTEGRVIALATSREMPRGEAAGGK